MSEFWTGLGPTLIAHTTALALPHGRRVGQPGHATAQQYLLAQLAQLGLQPFRGKQFDLPWRGAPLRGMANLVGVLPGRKSGLQPVLLGAHYDSVIDFPCADDNATAVAVVLAAAERLAKIGLDRDLVIALFDAEEPPYFLSADMGSTRFVVEQAADVKFACAIVLDLIGHDVESHSPALAGLASHLASLLVVTGCESAGYLPHVVAAEAAATRGLAVLPTHTTHVGDMSDYHAFRVQQQPFLFLTCGQGRYYHHPQDDLGWINFDKLERICELVVRLVLRIDANCPPGPSPPADTVDFEVRMLRQLLGDAWRPLLGILGLSDVRSREQLAQVAHALRQGLVA